MFEIHTQNKTTTINNFLNLVFKWGKAFDTKVEIRKLKITLSRIQQEAGKKHSVQHCIVSNS